MYDNPYVARYDLGVIDFDATLGAVHTIQVPNGRRGFVRKIILSQVSVAFTAGDGNAGTVNIGDGSDEDAYYASGPLTTPDATTEVEEKPNTLSKPTAQIEAGRSTVTVTANAATGTGDGTANVEVEIEWF